jgi:hypothetical protein
MLLQQHVGMGHCQPHLLDRCAATQMQDVAKLTL